MAKFPVEVELELVRYALTDQPSEYNLKAIFPVVKQVLIFEHRLDFANFLKHICDSKTVKDRLRVVAWGKGFDIRMAGTWTRVPINNVWLQNPDVYFVVNRLNVKWPDEFDASQLDFFKTFRID